MIDVPMWLSIVCYVIGFSVLLSVGLFVLAIVIVFLGAVIEERWPTRIEWMERLLFAWLMLSNRGGVTTKVDDGTAVVRIALRTFRREGDEA